MRYLSLFSGIEAASCAWADLGWEPVGFSEIEPFPCRVLQKRFPNVENLGDICKITKERLDALGKIDLIVGGSPCQGFSVAGKMEGLNDVRSKLALEYIRIIATARPKWIVWENVPGVFSTNRGMDFRIFTHQITELGYGIAWRVFDAQYFGVAQRRRRVFLVGSLGEGGAERAAEILFEQQSLRGDLAPCQGERSDTAKKTGDGAAAANGGGRKRSNTLTPTHGFDQSKRVYTTDGACACLDTHMAGNYIYQED